MMLMRRVVLCLKVLAVQMIVQAAVQVIPHNRCCAAPVHSADSLGSTYFPERSSFTWVPLLNFAPETSFLLALIGGWNVYPEGRDSLQRPNQFLGGVYGTLRGQFGVQMFPDIYFDNERIRLYFQVDVARFPDQFYGIGNALPESNREPFTLLRLAVIGSLLFNLEGKSIRTGWNIGPRFDIDYQNVIERVDNGLLATSTRIVGRSGGLLSGVGLAVNYDSRDKAIAPAAGEFIEARIIPYTRLTGSSFECLRLVLDARKFFPLPGEPGRHLVGVHWYTDYSIGDVPFFRMGLLGTSVNGASILRGYFGGRYRDKMSSALQAEYRFPIWWRFGGVLYGGVGDVAPSIGAFRFDNLKTSVGAGIRFALLPEERINLRVDVAYGFATGLPQFYISFAEAF